MTVPENENLSLTGKRILVVENEALIAMKIEMMIEDAGGEVVGPCATYRSAERAVEDLEFDAAILDVRVGDREIYPVASKLHSQGVGFVFYSAHAEVADFAELFSDVQLITKPASQTEIVEALVRLSNVAR